MNNQAYLKQVSPRLPIDQPKQAIKAPKTRLRFRPRGIRPFLTWGFALFLTFRVLLVPLVEGVYNLTVKSHELAELKAQRQKMSKQLVEMKKARDYMKTIAYVEERSHKAGFIKINESPMLVIDSSGGVMPEAERKRNVDIGD